ncbi:MAG: hypothetical protein H6Q93_776 [Nitrospirae bacterium]|nr:hypothetical protein [Nitrospirota bacterium]
MNSRRFSLKPFLTAGLPPDVKITGNISRSFNTLTITYMLIGPLTDLLIPSPAENPLRKDHLWEETCFEFFVAEKDSGQYWECNLSPSGHWNLYRFTSYRQGMQEETAFTALPFSVQSQPDVFRLSAEIDLEKFIPAEQVLQIAVSSVIKTIDGGITYWALIHPGPQADFHRRDSFIIDL